MTNIKIDSTDKPQIETLTQEPVQRSGAPPATATLFHDPQLARAHAAATRGDYRRCLDLLSSDVRTPECVNLRSVCLLRLNRPNDALTVLRPLVLASGGVWLKPDLPQSLMHNFATALLMTGKPSGCLDVLAELGKQQSPYADQLRGAIKKWAKSLPLWIQFNWRFGRIEPDNCSIQLDFEPGEL